MRLQRREFVTLVIGAAASVSLAEKASAHADPLPSWSEGSARDAVLKFVRSTTESTSPDFVPVEERKATFDLESSRKELIRVTEPGVNQALDDSENKCGRSAEHQQSVTASAHANPTLPSLSQDRRRPLR